MNALVTGGSRGIGKEIVGQLYGTGLFSRVLFTVRRAKDGEATVRDIRARAGEAQQQQTPLLQYYEVDITDREGVRRLAVELRRDLGDQEGSGALDLLVNNAGYATKGPHIDAQLARKVLDINYYGTRDFTEAMLPLIQPQRGRIVTVSSKSGLLGKCPKSEEIADDKIESRTVQDIDDLAEQFIAAVEADKVEERGWQKNAYATSKMLLNAWTRVREKEIYRDRGVVMNVVCPGWCRTDMGGESATWSAAQGADVAVWLGTELSMKDAHGQFYSRRKRMDF